MNYSIIHVISAYNIFGPEKVIIAEYKMLEKMGWKPLIVLIRPQGKSPFLEKVQKMGISCVHLVSNSKFDFTTIFRLKKIIQEHKCDLLHSNGYKSDVISLQAAALAGVPVVTTVHGWTSENLKVRFYEWLQSQSWMHYKKVICVSDYYKKKALRLGVPEEKLELIYNGIIINQGQSPAGTVPDYSGTTTNNLRVGVIGRLSIEKGHEYLLKAAHDIIKKGFKVEFIFAGDGPEEAHIKKLIHEFKLENCVKMLGYIEDTAALYSLIDIVVMPSLREGLPIVLLEAMLYEKVIIASRVGGIPEVIRDGQEGILVEPRNSSALADALTRIITDASLRQKLCANAKKRVVEDFSFEKRMEKIRQLYSQIIEEHKNR